EDLFWQLQNAADVERGAQAVGIEGRRSQHRLDRLEAVVVWLVGRTADAGGDVGQWVTGPWQGHAVPRLDRFGRALVEPDGEGRGAAEAYLPNRVAQHQGVQHADRDATAVGGVGRRPRVANADDPGGHRVAVGHQPAKTVFQLGDDRNSVIYRCGVEEVGDQGQAAHHRFPAVLPAQPEQRLVLGAGDDA